MKINYSVIVGGCSHIDIGSSISFKSNILTLIRYLSLAIVSISLLMNHRSILPTFQIIILLSFIINNQVRYFTLRDYRLLIFISFFIEVLIILTLVKLYPTNIYFYFLPLLIDITYILKSNFKYILVAFLLVTQVITSYFFNFNELVTSFSILLIFGALLIYGDMEHKSKRDAQKLYDKLKLSEEKLRKANIELEDYSHTIEELTLLKERNRISRDIHDSVGHALSTTMIQLNAIQALAAKDSSPIEPIAENLKNFVGESYQEVRRAVRELKPSEYSNYQDVIKIQDLINNFTKLSGVDVKLTVSEDKYALDAKVSLAIYRLVQESLSNASRHGKATKVIMTMIYNKNDLTITIKDNGIGCSNVVYGVGLTSITERFEEFNGTVNFNTSEGNGFVIKITVPKIVGDQYVN
ncbi:MAG: sensor histidine kinase [Clostridium sp.]